MFHVIFAKHKIEYILNEKERNYFPEYYLIETNEYIESKQKLMDMFNEIYK